MRRLAQTGDPPAMALVFSRDRCTFVGGWPSARRAGSLARVTSSGRGRRRTRRPGIHGPRTGRLAAGAVESGWLADGCDCVRLACRWLYPAPSCSNVTGRWSGCWPAIRIAGFGQACNSWSYWGLWMTRCTCWPPVRRHDRWWLWSRRWSATCAPTAPSGGLGGGVGGSCASLAHGPKTLQGPVVRDRSAAAIKSRTACAAEA